MNGNINRGYNVGMLNYRKGLIGANAEATDDLGRKPCESVPDPETFDMVPDAQELIDRMTKLLSEGLETNAAQASVGSLVKSSTKSISGGFSLITCASFHCISLN